jgi:hypothetical protein
MTDTVVDLQPGQLCAAADHTDCEHPEGALLWLGGAAWAHPKGDAADALLRPLNDVHPYPGNPRRGDQQQITGSIRDLGFYGTVQAQTSTAHIVVGNHRWRALSDLGAVLVPVEDLDVSAPVAAAVVARDNLTSDRADNDATELLALLRSSEEVLALSGYGDDDAMLRILTRRAEAEDVFTVGAEHMLDEFRDASGQSTTDYAREYARKVTVYLRDDAAIEDFKTRLGIEDDLGPRLHLPLGWEPYDRRRTWQQERDESHA